MITSRIQVVMEITAATLKLHLVPIASIRGPNERVPKPRPMMEMLHEKKLVLICKHTELQAAAAD